MTDFIQKTEEILEELFDSGKRYGEDIGYAKDDALYELREEALSEAKDFLRQALIEQHNRTVEECAKVLPKKMRLDSDRNTRLITIGHNSVIAECRMNILNLKK